MPHTPVSVSLLSWTKTYGDYIPGIYTIVHTFGSDLKYHPHFHVIITAGGLSIDKKKWIDSPGEYLLPKKGLKKQFRHQVIKRIIQANNKGLLKMPYLKKKGCYLNLREVKVGLERNLPSYVAEWVIDRYTPKGELDSEAKTKIAEGR